MSALTGGDTTSAGRNAGGGCGHTHRGHAVGDLSWSGQFQQGDVVVKGLAVVVRVGDGLETRETRTV